MINGRVDCTQAMSLACISTHHLIFATYKGREALIGRVSAVHGVWFVVAEQKASRVGLVNAVLVETVS